MPFRLMGPQEALTSEDLNFLQRCYEAAVASVTHVDDQSMRSTVARMIAAYNAGERDLDRMTEIAVDELRRAAG